MGSVLFVKCTKAPPPPLRTYDIEDVKAEDNGDWQTKGESSLALSTLGTGVSAQNYPLHMGVSGTPQWGMEDSVACHGHSGASASAVRPYLASPHLYAA